MMRTRILFVLVAISFCFLTGNVAHAFVEGGVSEKNLEANSPSEKNLMFTAIKDAYEYLPESQQKLIREGLVFKSIDSGPLAEEMAWGPEDDPDYLYPDKALYPKGAIKVNFGKKMISLLGDVYDENGFSELYEQEDPETTVKRFVVIEIIAHEIKHVEQYIEGPLSPLKTKEQCPQGVCDVDFVGDTLLKERYEFDALAFGWGVAKAAIARDGKENVEYREESVSDKQEIFYRGMVAPVLYAYACAMMEMHGYEFEGELKSSAQEFLDYNTENDNRLEEVYPYLVPVLERLRSCVQ